MSADVMPRFKSGNLVSEVRSLTGLRGIAALWVVLFHYLFPLPSSNAIYRFLIHGYLAVDLFFALSGFVMALNYSSMFMQGAAWKNFKLFLGRRLARVYPLYLFALLMSVFLLRDRHVFLGTQFWANLLLVQNFGYWFSFDTPSWSISTEWFAYLLFPWILPFSLFRGWRLAACTLLACTACLVAIAAGHVGVGSQAPLDVWHGPLSLVRCVSEFTLGVLAYRCSQGGFGHSLRQSSWAAYLLSAVSIALLCFRGTDLLVVLLWPLLVLSLAGKPNAISRALSSPPLEMLGLFSYSIYLLHRPLYTYVFSRLEPHLRNMSARHVHASAVMISFFPLLLISAGTYYGLEVPCRKLLRNLLEGKPGKLKRTQTPPANGAVRA